MFQMVVSSAAKLLEAFYPVHVLSRLAGTEAEFWEKQQLEANDWKGQAWLNYVYMYILLSGKYM